MELARVKTDLTEIMTDGVINCKQVLDIAEQVWNSVSYKPSSSPGSGLELVDRVYRLNSTHKPWTRESNSAWLTIPDPGLKLGS